jgi:predicted dithiol-disulfide oxidoreductase (DUF899 family)
MFGPEYTGGCPACSAIADGFNGFAMHLGHHDVNMIAVSRAPISALQTYKRRLGWTFTWASSLDSDFNYDFNTSFTAERCCSGNVDYNYRSLGSTRKSSIPVTKLLSSDKGGRDVFRNFLLSYHSTLKHCDREELLQLLKHGVSIGLGLIAFTRILRCCRWMVQERANNRIEGYASQRDF